MYLLFVNMNIRLCKKKHRALDISFHSADLNPKHNDQRIYIHPPDLREILHNLSDLNLRYIEKNSSQPFIVIFLKNTMTYKKHLNIL